MSYSNVVSHIDLGAKRIAAKRAGVFTASVNLMPLRAGVRPYLLAAVDRSAGKESLAVTS
jgi:hypothetical protein